MKKLLTFFLTALLAFTVGWAGTVTDYMTISDLGVTSTSYTNFSGKKLTSSAVYAGQCARNNNSGVYSIQLRATSPSGIVTTTSGGKVKSVTINFGSNTTNDREVSVYGKNTAYSSGADLYNVNTRGEELGFVRKTNSSLNGTVTVDGDYEYIGIRSASNALYISSIEIVWETGGSSSIAAPTISPNGGDFVTSQTVTLSHADADAIYYTTDDNDPNTSSTQYTTPFTINATTTVKAIAVKNNTPSSVASATFTMLPAVATVANANALGDNTKFGFTGNAVVTYQNGNNLWIRDQTRDTNSSGLIYGSLSGTFANGAILDAGWTATKTTYNGVPEFTSPSGVSSSSSTTADPEPLNTITTGDVNKYVVLSNVAIASSTINNNVTNYTVDGASYTLRDHFGLVTLTVGKTYDVIGVVSIYSNAPQLYLISATEVTTGDPTIIVSPTSLTINDSGTNNTFTVEATNLENNDQGNVGVGASSSDFGLTFSSSTNEYATWGFLRDYNREVHGTVAVNYNGRALSASTTVTAATQGDSKTVNVNYVADLYIVTDNGVTGDWHFDGTNGEHMTNTNGVYTATFTAENPNTYILFARKLGDGVTWNTRYVFGPSSTDDWWLPADGNGGGTIDVYSSHPIKIQGAGTYIVTIDANNANNYTFTIEKEVIPEGTLYEKVTSTADLVDGDYLIVYEADGKAFDGSLDDMDPTGNVFDVTINNNKIVTERPAYFTIDATNGTIQSASGYYIGRTTSSNGFNQSATVAYTHEISFDNDGNAIITSSGGPRLQMWSQMSNGVMQYRFRYYTSNQKVIQLYRKHSDIAEPRITVNPTSLDLVIPVGSSSVDGTVTVTESNTTGTTSVDISGTGASNFSATLENGTLTVTYSGTATQANPDQATITLTNGTATATVTVTGYKRVQATGTLYTKVTSADQIQDGLQYILVYEGTPEALNGITTGGTGATIAWETQGSVVNISGTDAIEFTLNGNASGFTLSSDHGYLNPNAPGLAFDNSEGTQWSAESNSGGYVLKYGDYMLRYNTGMSSPTNGRFRIYNGTTGQPVYLYVQGESASVANPVINPASGRYSEDQEVTITCSTTGATIYYTVNGGETQTYTEPFTVDVDEEHTEATVVAWAVKDDLTSDQVTATYTYYSYNGHVSSIAEFLELSNGEEAIFDNPVVVLFDYSQNSGGGQEYIWIKDRTDYTQLFITPQFDAASVADPQYDNYGQFVPKYENGDVIPAGFKVKKNYYDKGQYVQAMCTDTHNTFQIAEDKALADPEQVTLSELLDNPANYNNRYLYINKMQVNYSGTGLNFDISADENGDDVSEVQGGSAIVGYNKYNSPAWKNKDGDVVGVTLPTDNNYYNVKFIFQKWDNGYEIMPIEFTLWEETSLLLEDLVQVGEVGQPYTISNQLHAARVTWDANRSKFAIFAKDDEMYANKRYPAAGQETYVIDFENQVGDFINTVDQADYDQSNWIEILIPTTVTGKQDLNYQSTLDQLKDQYQNKILKAATVSGTYVDKLNPTIEVTANPQVDQASDYNPNIYCTANFLRENLDADGAKSYRTDELGNQYFFMMDAKPQEFCMVVWAYYEGSGDYFVAPAQEGDVINGHNFRGGFKVDMSLCEDQAISEQSVSECFAASNSETPEVLYGFDAIVRKNPLANRNGGPRNIQPNTDPECKEGTPDYIVYPINAGDNAEGNVTAVKEMLGTKEVESVRYYNVMGVESDKPFEGINIVVTRFTDGTTMTMKVLK